MNTQTKIAVAFSVLLSSGLASAAPLLPLKIDVGLASLPAGGQPYGAGGDADTVTGAFTELAFNQFFASSLYEKDFTTGLFTGNIIDTNNVATLTSLGLPLPSYGQTTIGNLSPLTPPGGIVSDAEGFGVTWGLVAAYNLTGTIPTNGAIFTGPPSFSGGTYDIYFDDYSNGLGADTQVLGLTLNSSDLQVANLTLNFTTNFALPGFLSINGQDAATIPGLKFVLDTNVNPPIPDPNTLLNVTDGTNRYGARQTTLDGSISPLVPEPNTIALLGLGLMGFAAARRKAS